MRHETAPSVDQAVLERCLAVLRRAPAGLFTDIDGTICAIAPTPAEAVVTEAARAALQRLAARLDFVGVITGRLASDGAAMVGIPGVTVVGNHGLERRQGDTHWIHPSAATAVASLTQALDEIRNAAKSAAIDEGLIFEHKHLTASIHYRLSPQPEAVREHLLARTREAAERHGLRVTEGRFVIEIRPRVVVNKGTAIVDLARERALSGVAYFGDDVTDVDAFVAIRALRENDGIGTVAVAVLSAETHPSVAEAADVSVLGVDGCVALLTALADALEADSSTTTSR